MARTFGRYRLLRHLATGGMGEVWLAEAAGAAGFVKRLVIKTLRPELAADARLVEQFVAEGRLLEALDHPNIAQILDLGCIDGEWFLAMEWVQGFDLRALRRALPSPDGLCKLGASATLAIVASAASALDHAATRQDERGQRLRIVHHDVTPSNLMVRRDGLVKLVDFGVARSALLAHVEMGALRGKIPYLAPEQLQGGVVDHRTDLFALGLCAFEMLTGERALQAADVDGLPAAWQALPARLAMLDDVGCDPGVAALVRSLCALDLDARPEDAGRVAAEAAERSVQLGVGRPELVLAHELAPAFARLEAQEGGFDATLAGMVAVDRLAEADGTGTLSLPGLASPSPTRVAGGEIPGLFATPTPAASAGSGALTPAPAGVDPVAPVATAPAPRSWRSNPTVWLSVALFVAVVALVAPRLGGGGGGGPPDRDGGPGAAGASAPGDVPGGAGGLVVDAGAAAAAGTPSGAASSSGAEPTPDEARALGADAGAAWGIDTSGAAATGTAAVAPEAAAPASTALPGAATASSDDADTRTRRAEAAVADNERDDPPGTPRSAGTSRADGKPDPAEAKDEGRGRREAGTAVIRFRVVPADAEVLIDGKVVAGGAGSTGVHELRVPAGSRRIEVRDPTTAAVERRTLSLRSGDERNLPGFVLVGGLP